MQCDNCEFKIYCMLADRNQDPNFTPPCEYDEHIVDDDIPYQASNNSCPTGQLLYTLFKSTAPALEERIYKRGFWKCTMFFCQGTNLIIKMCV